MFMVEGVPLQLLEQVGRVHDLQAEPPLRAKGGVCRRQQRPRVGVVSERVASCNDVSRSHSVAYLAGYLGRESAGNDIVTFSPGHLADIARKGPPRPPPLPAWSGASDTSSLQPNSTTVRG